MIPPPRLFASHRFAQAWACLVMAIGGLHVTGCRSTPPTGPTPVVLLDTTVTLMQGVTCNIETGKALVTAGLHPATGGTGLSACSGDMLLEALVACAGVTLNAVATALGIVLREGSVLAEGDLDFRGTLGVSKDVPVGFREIRLSFALDTDASDEQLATLLRLTERYCVVYQTLAHPPSLASISRELGRDPADAALAEAAPGATAGDAGLQMKIFRREGVSPDPVAVYGPSIVRRSTDGSPMMSRPSTVVRRNGLIRSSRTAWLFKTVVAQIV